MTPDPTPFLRAIGANPADDNVRLVYADFLEENGNAERAEYIRVLVRDRVGNIEYDGGEDNPFGFRLPGVTLVARRGFVHTVRGPLRHLLYGECRRCCGHGDTDITRHPQPPAGEWTCPDCHGTGRDPNTPGALERMGGELLCVERAEITETLYVSGDQWSEQWWLPTTLRDVFIWAGIHVDEGWPTEADALSALSGAILAAALAVAAHPWGLVLGAVPG